jgi:hypothetical protein
MAVAGLHFVSPNFDLNKTCIRLQPFSPAAEAQSGRPLSSSAKPLNNPDSALALLLVIGRWLSTPWLQVGLFACVQDGAETTYMYLRCLVLLLVGVVKVRTP